MEALTRNSIFTLSVVLEGALLLIAAVWVSMGNIALLPKFQFAPSAFVWGLLAACFSTAVSLSCITLGKGIPILAKLRQMSEDFLAPMIALLSAGDIIFLSIVSGFCEEVLFRGVMQAQFGLLATSFIFGVFHDPSFKQKGYVILACLAGLGLGVLYQQTGNLWSCITAHAVHNFFAMLALRYWLSPGPKEGP